MECRLIHALPGRIRFKVPALQQGKRIEAELRQRLEQIAELQNVEVKPLSSSVILYCDPSHYQRVMARVEDLFGAAAVAVEKKEKPESAAAAAAINETMEKAAALEIADLFRRLDARVEQTTGWGLRLLIPVLLAFLAWLLITRAALRGKKTPLPDWHDLLWFAFNTFVMLNLPPPMQMPMSGTAAAGANRNSSSKP